MYTIGLLGTYIKIFLNYFEASFCTLQYAFLQASTVNCTSFRNDNFNSSISTNNDIYKKLKIFFSQSI